MKEIQFFVLCGNHQDLQDIDIYLYIYIYKTKEREIYTYIYPDGKKNCKDMEVSREDTKIWAENGKGKRKVEVKFSAKADNSERGAEGSFKQGKRLSEIDVV